MHKIGFYPQLALRSLRLNGKFYLPYLLSGMVSAAMLYDILFLNMNRGIYALKGVNAVQGLLGFEAIVVALFSFALLCYTNGFLMKRRQKELGLYNILGMEKRHLARLLLWETIFAALLCILGGLLLGVLLSKLFLLLLCAVIQAEVPFGFEVPRDAAVYTAVVFGGIFLLNYLLNLLRLNRVKPIELLHGGESGEREPRTKWVLTALGLLTIGAGYGLSLTVSDPVNALTLFFLAVVLVIVGTYCLFTAGSIALLKALRKNKKYYYQTRHFTAVSGMLHRMKRNAAGLATICILSTMVLVTVSTTVCLYMGVNDILDRMYCRDVQTYVNRGAPEDLPKLKALYERKAAELGVEMKDFAALCFYATFPTGGKLHPRVYGAFSQVIETYVNGRHALTLPEAVNRMTRRPADRYGLKHKGRIALGADADVLVFDPKRVHVTATYDQPAQRAEGMDYVIVNGRIALENGRLTGVQAGNVLEGNR